LVGVPMMHRVGCTKRGETGQNIVVKCI
jgi:hypothetical protein